jgi:hypothetical protein
MDNEEISHISGFLRHITGHRKAFANAKSLYQDRLAPDFTPFEFIKCDELGLSKLLGWLFDSAGSHGQGGLFLWLFVEQVGVPWSRQDCEVATTRLEVSVQQAGRIDILIRSRRNAIAIENKPYAGDQQEQLSRYFQFLDEQKLDGQCIVYLTPDGSAPSEYSMLKEKAELRVENRQLLTLGYVDDIGTWLASCRTACRADRVVVFLDQFEELLSKTFEGVQDVTERNHLVNEILGSADYLASAMSVIQTKAKIRSALLEKLHSDLQSGLAAGWKLDWSADFEKARSGFNIDFGESCQTLFRIEFFQSNMMSANYGVQVRDPKAAPDEYIAKVRDALKTSIGGNKDGGRWWPWWGAGMDDPFLPFERDWNNKTQPWLAVQSGELATQIIIAAERVSDALKRHGLLE